MCSRFLEMCVARRCGGLPRAVIFGVLGLLAVALGACAHRPVDEAASGATELRVCADPDNLPYSKEDGSGFENRIAQVLASDLHLRLTYAWLPQRRGFVRKTVGAGLCDVFIGVPDGFERLLLTRPYYRSSYVFVQRAADPPLDGFEPRALSQRRIGVQLIGDDLAATPPAYALARAGATDNVTGYTVYGDGPASERMVNDIAAGRIDVALGWGPQLAYFANRAAVPLTVERARPPAGSALPFEFSVAVGVNRAKPALRDELQAALDRRHAEIDAILADYNVVRVDAPRPVSSAARESAR
ncbi:mxaJ protein [Paraburkholderia graminis]|jgi:mxaJ protein|uniref:MxaJ protein n=1 Tax=Paraburkholderia graminis TaxID=60548 RepID=A0ABD5CSI6_9BURK|nr:mxaJ protein [Paraburkholderia graminis]